MQIIKTITKRITLLEKQGGAITMPPTKTHGGICSGETIQAIARSPATDPCKVYCHRCGNASVAFTRPEPNQVCYGGC